MCTAPRRRLTAVGQSLACSYDIHGCVARVVVSAIARAPTPVTAPSRFGPSPSTRSTRPAVFHHRRRAAIVAETTGALGVLGGFEIPDCRVRVPSEMGAKQAAPSRLARLRSMEPVIAPPEIVAAIRRGDLEAIKAWVAAGGDPNAKRDCSHEQRFVDRDRWNQPLPPGSRYETILHRAADFKWAEICEFLLSRGARVDTTDASEGCPIWATPLWHAMRSCSDVPVQDTLATVRVILSHGADPNLHATYYQGGAPTPLCQLLFSSNLWYGAEFDDHRTDLVPIVRMLLRSGADPEGDQGRLTAEGHARISNDLLRQRSDEHCWGFENIAETADQCAEAADLLAAVRIAGSWSRYFLQPHMSCMVFRALCHRGRARFYLSTPTVLVRLFGASPILPVEPDLLVELLELDPRKPDLPDVVFWRVLTFMFGTAYDYPWVRPRLRARAAAAAAA